MKYLELARTALREPRNGNESLPCPPCTADRGMPADVKVGEPGWYYKCPDCGDEWAEA